MRTWDDWSDFEINKAVAVKLGMIVDGSYPDSNAVCAGKESGMLKPYDWCSSWADIGPLLFKNHISIMQPDEGDELWNAIHWCDGGECMYDEYHKSPLRAAAIVFLMMNGVKP